MKLSIKLLSGTTSDILRLLRWFKHIIKPLKVLVLVYKSYHKFNIPILQNNSVLMQNWENLKCVSKLNETVLLWPGVWLYQPGRGTVWTAPACPPVQAKHCAESRIWCSHRCPGSCWCHSGHSSCESLSPVWTSAATSAPASRCGKAAGLWKMTHLIIQNSLNEEAFVSGNILDILLCGHIWFFLQLSGSWRQKLIGWSKYLSF